MNPSALIGSASAMAAPSGLDTAPSVTHWFENVSRARRLHSGGL